MRTNIRWTATKTRDPGTNNSDPKANIRRTATNIRDPGTNNSDPRANICDPGENVRDPMPDMLRIIAIGALRTYYDFPLCCTRRLRRNAKSGGRMFNRTSLILFCGMTYTKRSRIQFNGCYWITLITQTT